MILERMIWLYLNDVEKTPFTYQPSCPIFKKQYMMLNAARLYEFLNHYLDENPDFRLDILFHPQGLCRPHIVRGWPEAEFLLEPWIWQDKGKPAFPCYALSLREKTQRQGLSVYSAQTYAGAAQAEGIRLLSKDARMLLYNQTIYLTPDESAALPRLFYTALAGRERIILQEKDMPTLLNLILPVDELRAHLTLDPAVRERIVHSKMSALVRLDRCGQGIIAEVEFHYGKTVINPHPEATDQTDLNQGESSAWLMRDESGERKILTLLTEAGFRDRPPTRISRSDQAGAPPLASTSAYHLYDEEAIYRFLKEMLPRLCAAATVYYSDRFEKIKVHSVPALSGQIRLMSAQNLLEVSFDAREYSVEEIRQILQAYREKRRYTRLKSGDFIELPEYSPDHELTLLEQADLWGAEFAEDGLQIAPYRALPLHALLKERSNGPTSFSTDPDFDRLIDTLARPFEADFAVPTTVRATLRPYQIAGYRWLCGLSHYGFGGILADEMGLGKTLQILLFIEHFKTQVRLPSLVIVPTSLLYNWQNEAAKFFPEMNVLIYSGPKSARLAMAEDLRAADLVVVSYAVARQDIKELREIEFGVCVLDEAQFIKNPLTRTARAVKRIKALRRFALTGTPIENALSELWSIFDFLMPGYLFGHRKFQQEWEIPIVRNKDPEVLEQLVRLTRPFILRRLKKDVLKELPDKIETRLICEMNEEQRTLYDAYLSQARIRARDLLATETGAAGRRQIELLSLLTRLRQICCHPALFLDGYTGGSGKLDSLNDQMERLLSEGHRVLLFSQFTGMLALIQQAQSEQGRSIFYIDGAVSAEERMRRVERFNAGEGDLFLVSLKAGGTGLNIVGADTVIHYDPWWNPAVEEQATDRAHRLGQKRVVQIFRFITRNSIEEKIQELKEHKCRLADRVIRSDPNFLSRLSQEELLALFE
jgi:superfamily II DNA or RNA helicase